MARYLVTLSLGPVQSLIGAARRTRDLWCGSWLLSEAARAAARVLHERHPGGLIFPCPEDPYADLMPRDQPGDAANVGNVVRAEVELPDSDTARALCHDARAAAVSRVTAIGESVRQKMTKLERPLRDDVWRAQIDDILEAFAAWAPIQDGSDGYQHASCRLGRALAARKATRDFRPCQPLETPALPKSSLDGALETVLPNWPAGDSARRRLGLASGFAGANGAGGEQLDALGVIKRLAGDAEQFTAWPRIAADTWIERLGADQQQRLRAAYAPLVDLQHATRVRDNGGIYSALPFDGHLLYPFRLENALRQHGALGTAAEIDALKELQYCIERISKEKSSSGQSVGYPVPYAAILKADGDRMGQLLSRAKSAEQSQAISRSLYQFASRVPCIVREHRGHAIYAGGDDVLALVSLARARSCADALARAFKNALGEIAANRALPDDKHPTLSVGLGIGHVIEPLGALRARADRAEHDAKGNATATPRNALAIRLGIRSGAELCWRARWTDEPAIDALDRFATAYRTGSLPARVAYDLRAMERRLAWLHEDGEEDDIARGMRSAEVERLLNRARGEGGGQHIAGDLRRLIGERAKHQPLGELADTLIIARWLAARTGDDVGERR